MSRFCEAPMVREARTKSRTRRVRTSPRTRRAETSQEKAPMISERLMTLAP